MQRDDDYLRQLLLEMEADPFCRFPGASGVMSPSESETKRDHHMALLLQAELLAPAGGMVEMINAGHDFLANTRKNENWEAIKAAHRRAGWFSVSIMQRAISMGIWPGSSGG